MNIPQGYRRLEDGEVILATDIYERPRAKGSFGTDWPEAVGEIVGRSAGRVIYTRYGDTWQILRKTESAWIAMSERKPTRDDGSKLILLMPDGEVTWGQPGSINAIEATHWMPFPEVPGPKPITIREGSAEREVVFNKDGSLQVGCVKVSSELFEKIAARRKEVYES